MEIEIFDNHESLSEAVANHILDIVRKKPKATLVLTSGNTPIKAYQKITKLAKQEDFANTFIIGLTNGWAFLEKVKAAVGILWSKTS